MTREIDGKAGATGGKSPGGGLVSVDPCGIFSSVRDLVVDEDSARGATPTRGRLAGLTVLETENRRDVLPGELCVNRRGEGQRENQIERFHELHIMLVFLDLFH